MVHKELDYLSDLLGEYIDLETEVYRLSLSKLQNEGITLKFEDLNLINDELFVGNNCLKRNPTFSELIQEQCLVVFDNILSSRKFMGEPVLLGSEIYEITLTCGQATHKLPPKTLKTLTSRLNHQGTVERENYILSSPQFFQNELYHKKTLYIHIKLINVDLNEREKLEKNWNLNLDGFNFAQKVYQKMINELNHDLCSDPVNRLKLFNCSLDKFNNSLNKTKEYLQSLPFDFWGIRNLLQIQDISHKFSQKEINNDDLLKMSSSCMLKIQNLNHFKSCLINNIPFESINYLKLKA
jgi:hypothetical protein